MYAAIPRKQLPALVQLRRASERALMALAREAWPVTAAAPQRIRTVFPIRPAPGGEPVELHWLYRRAERRQERVGVGREPEALARAGRPR